MFNQYQSHIIIINITKNHQALRLKEFMSRKLCDKRAQDNFKLDHYLHDMAMNMCIIKCMYQII